MPPTAPLRARLAQAVRFDGLWWRRFAYLGCVYGPDWWTHYSPPVIAAIIFAIVGRNRRGAITNLQRILDQPDRRRAGLTGLRMFAEFAHCLTETTQYYGPRPRAIRLDTPQHDPLAEALRAGRGAVVVTGHFGNWDIAAKALCDYGRPINVVMAREVNATTQEYVRSAREQAGVRVIFSDSSVFSSLNMIRALRQNEVVAIQLDRMLGPGGARQLPFFGALAPFPSGPFVLARLAGAPVIPVFIPRLGPRHYAIRVTGRFFLAREARDAHALDRVMGEVVREFEAMIREFPTQWFQFAPFWPAAAAAALPAVDEIEARPQRRLRR
ncbi:MAG: lysophospholipid acyltransferase family protein [Deltaproteobacteria bacterium]|nr:lysophospholipid acyltransferase family protein [Deltaproteobacteria bacterium]